MERFGTVSDLAAQIPDGASLALAPDYSGCALAVVRALIRRRARELHLVGVPQLGFQADLLIGAGCVAGVETAAVTLGEQGPAPRFTAAVKAGRIEVRDSTCPVLHAGLQAAEKGVPFLPLRGILGSDLVRHRTDWRVIDNPFAAPAADGLGDPILLVPAIRSRRRAVPRGARRSRGQRLDRRPARADDHGARRQNHARYGRGGHRR